MSIHNLIEVTKEVANINDKVMTKFPTANDMSDELLTYLKDVYTTAAVAMFDKMSDRLNFLTLYGWMVDRKDPLFERYEASWCETFEHIDRIIDHKPKCHEEWTLYWTTLKKVFDDAANRFYMELEKA